MKNSPKILFSLLAVLLVAVATPASANLVTNGGFETGDFTGWTHVGNTTFDGVTGGPYANSGSFGAFLGPVGSTASLSQSLTTIAGAFYDLSFFLASNPNGGTSTDVFGQPVDFRILWNGVTIFDASAVGSTFTQFNFLVQATGASTNLEFVYRKDVGFFALDDVSVLAHAATVPETGSSVMLMGLALAGMAGARRIFGTQRTA